MAAPRGPSAMGLFYKLHCEAYSSACACVYHVCLTCLDGSTSELKNFHLVRLSVPHFVFMFQLCDGKGFVFDL